MPIADSLPEFERQVQGLLAAAAASNRHNVLDAAEVFESIGETHREIEQDSRAHGDSSAGTYWDLVMADGSYDEDAFFAVWFWREDSLTVCAGKGDRAAVLETCNRHSMAELEEAFAAMDEMFHIAGTGVSLSRSVAEPWAFDQGAG